MSIANKLRYLRDSAVKTVLRQGFKCPSCGGEGPAVDRKMFITALRRCTGCELLYRTPTTSDAENQSFYQDHYDEGHTTKLPSEAQLQEFKEDSFAGMDGHYPTGIEILRRLSAGKKVLDYGCSWGYGSYQLRRAGFDVDSYEISKHRAAYAKNNLGANIVQPSAIAPIYDVFFSSHVIEHVPSVSNMIQFGLSVLKPNGLFVAFAPNGSETYRKRQPVSWHTAWGLVHPQVIDEVFLERHLASRKYLVASSPYKELTWGVGDLTGNELLFVVRA